MDGKEEKNENKKDEQEQKGGEPAWVQKLEQSMNRLAEKLETSQDQTETDSPVQVPVPPTPEPEPEPETPEEPEQMDEPDEPETQQEQRKSKAKSFLDWLL